MVNNAPWWIWVLILLTLIAEIYWLHTAPKQKGK
jgi:hypothetical protein